MAQIHSPFKFLAPYGANDKENFWGRDKETLELYKMLSATNLVLLYGPSGTGKTSLAQCGLTNHFNGPDWIPIFVRRGENISRSVNAALREISKLPEDARFRNHINHIYETYDRPVYLFFDQFEEVFTLAERDENKKIIVDRDGKLAEVTQLFDTIGENLMSQRCKFVLILREEFLGQLYTYEKDLQALFDFRLRVEPMNASRIDDVLEGTFKVFNITYVEYSAKEEHKPQNVKESIATNLLEGNATGQLAYLQVYLDRLWRKAYGKAYGNEEWVRTPPPLKLTEDTLGKVGTVEKVLEEYLEEQEKTIAESLGIESTWVRDLLDSFVTDDRTKRPIPVGSLLLNPKERLTPAQLHQCLTQLQDARLIRKDNQYYELAHDALAAIVASKRTVSQRLIRDITQIIRTNYQFWMDKQGGYLSKENVALYDQYNNEVSDELVGNDNKKAILIYIEDSREENERERQELEDKNKSLRVSNKRQKRALTVAGILSIGLLFVMIWGWNQYRNSERNLGESKQNLSKFHHEKASQLKLDAKVFADANYYQDALKAAMHADSLVPNSQETKSMIEDYRKKLPL